VPFRIACVVEGHGEVFSVPILLRRIARDVRPELLLDIPNPLRQPKQRLLKQGELERAVELASRKARPNGAVLVVLDADDQCPKELAPALLGRVQTAAPHVPSAVVIANREYEAWLIAAAESLCGHRGFKPDLTAPTDPESIRGAKEWLGRWRTPPRYAETVDQPALTAIFDIQLARQRSPSFDKFCREVEHWFLEASGADP